MKKLGVAVLAGLVLAAGVVFTADSKSDKDMMRELRDRADIEELMWRYARALDTNDPEGYASAYTPDGQFGTGPNATKGREALTKMVSGLRQRQAEAKAKGETRPPLYHMTANHRIQFTDKDHARIEAYCTSPRAPPAAPIRRRVWPPLAAAWTSWCASTASG